MFSMLFVCLNSENMVMKWGFVEGKWGFPDMCPRGTRDYHAMRSRDQTSNLIIIIGSKPYFFLQNPNLIIILLIQISLKISSRTHHMTSGAYKPPHRHVFHNLCFYLFHFYACAIFCERCWRSAIAIRPQPYRIRHPSQAQTIIRGCRHIRCTEECRLNTSG